MLKPPAKPRFSSHIQFQYLLLRSGLSLDELNQELQTYLGLDRIESARPNGTHIQITTPTHQFDVSRYGRINNYSVRPGAKPRLPNRFKSKPKANPKARTNTKPKNTDAELQQQYYQQQQRPVAVSVRHPRRRQIVTP